MINFYILSDQSVDSPCSLRFYCVQPHTHAVLTNICKIMVSKLDEILIYNLWT